MAKALVQPYLFFGGRCEEAIAFYRDALGAELDMLMRFDEAPDPTPPGMLPPGYEKKVMHAQFRVGDCVIMVGDGCSVGQDHAGYSLAVSYPTEAEVDRAFARLSDGGTVSMPLGKTFWSPRFGMVKDKFGVSWFVSMSQAC